MPDGISPVWDVRRGGGLTMHRQGVDVHRVTQRVDPLSGLRCRTHRKIYDCALMAHAWDRAGY